MWAAIFVAGMLAIAGGVVAALLVCALSLSVAIFLLVLFSYWMGWIGPGGIR